MPKPDTQRNSCWVGSGRDDSSYNKILSYTKSIKNKGFLIAFSIFILLSFGDAYSTLQFISYGSSLELNPIYRMTGTFLPVIILFIMNIVLIWYVYNRSKNPTIHYGIVGSLIISCWQKVGVIKSNLSFADTLSSLPIEKVNDIAAEASRLSIEQTSTFYLTTSMVDYITPLVLSLIIFLFFKIDHKI